MRRSLLITLFAAVIGLPAAHAAGREKKEPPQNSETFQASSFAPQTNSMTIWQARRTVAAWLKNAGKFPVKSISEVKITEKTIAFNVDSTFYDGIDAGYAACFMGKALIDLRTVGSLSARPAGKAPHVFFSLYMDGQDLRATTLPKSSLLSTKFGCGKHLNILGIFAFNTAAQAQEFVDALSRLSAFARGGDAALAAEWRDFRQKAAAWRALAVKPAMPESVRKHRLLAEHAVNERQFEEAVEEYEAGIDIYPCWPEGHFNAALIYAELKRYSDALRHMRAYVELVPEAPDASQARDQMVIWEAELAKAR